MPAAGVVGDISEAASNRAVATVSLTSPKSTNMRIEDFALQYACRTVCPHAMGNEPQTPYEIGAVRQLRDHLILFWSKAHDEGLGLASAR